MTNKDLHDKVKGCLVGGAVGDALGYPVEFLNYRQIVDTYGEEGITRYYLSASGVAEISDDTQMTLFTANGLLINDMRTAYLEWLDTQSWLAKPDAKSCKCWISKIPQLYSRRAPGNTCLTALHSIAMGHKAKNNSKGCGGIMRIAPVALYGAAHDWPIEKTARLAGEAAEITHLHQMSTLASACSAAIIQLCVMEEDSKTTPGFSRIVQASLDCIENLYPTFSAVPDFKALIAKALILRDRQSPDWEIIENMLGGGWVAEETLAIAVFSVTRHIDNFADCLVCAVNHSGDSDSTGAVGGNFMGAIHGYSAIPDYFKDNLELRDVLETMSDDLITGIPSH